jgi:hypothetical protein
MVLFSGNFSAHTHMSQLTPPQVFSANSTQPAGMADILANHLALFQARNYSAIFELPAGFGLRQLSIVFRRLLRTFHPDKNIGQESEATSISGIISSSNEYLVEGLIFLEEYLLNPASIDSRNNVAAVNLIGYVSSRLTEDPIGRAILKESYVNSLSERGDRLFFIQSVFRDKVLMDMLLNIQQEITIDQNDTSWESNLEIMHYCYLRWHENRITPAYSEDNSALIRHLNDSNCKCSFAQLL